MTLNQIKTFLQSKGVSIFNMREPTEFIDGSVRVAHTIAIKNTSDFSDFIHKNIAIHSYWVDTGTNPTTFKNCNFYRLRYASW
jgi:hypothetical protein